MAKEVLTENLNPQQREAVLYNDGPMLVLAGAGSGKTRVITYKFAYLVKKKRFPASSIFTVTFTNKAADEMKQRINLFFSKGLKQTWIGTFHSLCNRILRREIDVLGYRNDFSIYDEEERASLIKQILKDFNIHEALYKGVCNKISLLKSALISPEDFLTHNNGYSFDEKLGRVYLRYQDELKRFNALDFDDLVLLTIQLFKIYPSILKKYHDLFSYILVDEFQDTNQSQYTLLKILASQHRNICVVGDDDQSIYKFRGADIQNIFNFKKDFSEVKVIKLEQNYRSTQNILNVSNHLISKNFLRNDKKLWTDKCTGERVFYCRLNNEEEEARYVARSIKDLYLKANYEYRDFAVLYRINIQAKAIEDALRAESIPYHIISGISFYQRKEIKDLISYLKVIMNPDDNVSLVRIINSFYRGIGNATISKIELEARNLGLSLFATIKSMIRSNGLTLTIKNKLHDLIANIESISSKSFKNTADLLKEIIDKTDYVNRLDDKRLQNLFELISSAENTSLREFLDKVSLISSADDSPKGNSVSLMTLHNAKGLEFPVVFIIGLEDGILPYFKAIDDGEELQEERRLLYVGMTRARDYLCLTGAKRRKLFSKYQDFEPSRFLADIPRECCNWIEKIQPTIEDSNDDKAPMPPSSPYALTYSIGTKVKHPVWGVGVIRDCYGEGEDKKVMINFPGIGIKRLALKFANLQTMA
ncbi:MAG: UvrD-helicase domain-containing protein [Thermodesulfovibrionales bacterium]|nr:UvrD-helicase domain-containing protein [Thermodesulfovibrionales bacterium]